MRAVVQRVTHSSVKINGEVTGEIEKGLNVFLGVEEGDGEKDIEYMVDKVANLRIFEDGEGKMNLSLVDVGGKALVISQFTLLGDCRKGRRPNFMNAAEPGISEDFYEKFCKKLENNYSIPVETGNFREYMEVFIVNDGPVTLLIDSRKNF